MARTTNRLTSRTVATLSRPGRHADGGGLYLVIDKGGAKRWALLATIRGRRREIGLGGLSKVNGLVEARAKALDMARMIAAGEDPTRPSTASLTFAEASEQIIADLAPGWRGAKTEEGWRRSLITHAAAIGRLPVDQITTEDVLGVVRPLWSAKPESGGKLRARIEVALDAAKARGWRTGENPARWRGHMDRLLPRRRKLTRGHHRALPYADMPTFMAQLGEETAMSARALEWTILTAAREDMTLGMTWGEISPHLWTIPAERMKISEHRVPLPTQAVAILDHVKIGDPPPGQLVFPGARKGKPLSNSTMDALLARMRVDATPHGFRSTFRDWAGDMTDHPREVAEAALAHVVGSSTERAYRRGDALEKRRALMQDWADYCWSKRTKAPTPEG